MHGIRLNNREIRFNGPVVSIDEEGKYLTIILHGERRTYPPHKYQNEVELFKYLELNGVVKIYDQGVTDRGALYTIVRNVYRNLTNVFHMINSHPQKDTIHKIIMFNLLQYTHLLHMSGIAHLNIRPTTVYIDENMNVLILDPWFDYALTRYDDRHHSVAPSLDPDIYERVRRKDKTDVWALGLILISLLTSNKHYMLSTFSGGTYIREICRLLGTTAISKHRITSSVVKSHIESRICNADDTFEEEFGSLTTPDAIDLLRWMLQYNSTDRLTAEECLRHPYFKDFFDEDVLVCKGTLNYIDDT